MMIQPAEYWITHLDLKPHPEGGFFKETYRSAEQIGTKGLAERFNGSRSFSTAIYFLLRAQDKSLFHRIKSDELWHFHAGSTLNIYVLRNNNLEVHKLGSDLENGDSLQVTIPANCWFGATVNGSGNYTLSSCTVAPGFDFADFELAHRSELLLEFPTQKEIITTLTV